jgi:hypothetical protein
VGVVKTNQPLAVPAVESQRIVQAVRLLRRGWYTRHHETNAATTLRVNDECQAIEIQQGVEGRVVLRHLL